MDFNIVESAPAHSISQETWGLTVSLTDNVYTGARHHYALAVVLHLRCSFCVCCPTTKSFPGSSSLSALRC